MKKLDLIIILPGDNLQRAPLRHPAAESEKPSKTSTQKVCLPFCFVLFSQSPHSVLSHNDRLIYRTIMPHTQQIPTMY